MKPLMRSPPADFGKKTPKVQDHSNQENRNEISKKRRTDSSSKIHCSDSESSPKRTKHSDDIKSPMRSSDGNNKGASKNDKEINDLEKEKLLYEKYQKEQEENERLENIKRQNKKNNESDTEASDSHRRERRDSDSSKNEVTVELLNANILRRDLIVKSVYKPFFDHIKGIFVRVALKNGYAICKVIDVIFGNEYDFTIKGKKFTTDKYLVIQHGSNQIKFPISFVSNSDVEASDFNIQRKGIWPKPEALINEFERTKKLFERKLSGPEEKKAFEEKRKFMFTPSKRLSYFKADLLRKCKEAFNEKKNDIFNEMLDEIKAIDEKGNAISSFEINELARKWNLVIPGELEKVVMTVKKDY